MGLYRVSNWILRYLFTDGCVFSLLPEQLKVVGVRFHISMKIT